MCNQALTGQKEALKSQHSEMAVLQKNQQSHALPPEPESTFLVGKKKTREKNGYKSGKMDDRTNSSHYQLALHVQLFIKIITDMVIVHIKFKN